MKIKDSPFLENSAVGRVGGSGAEHCVWLGTGAPRTLGTSWVQVFLMVIFANDSKYLEEGAPCGIHRGVPSRLAVT